MRRSGLHTGARVGLDGGVPTHRDHPWERDARSGRGAGAQRNPPSSREVLTAGLARQRPRRPAHGGGAAAPRATWKVPVVVGIVALVAISGMSRLGTPGPVASATGPPPPSIALPSRAGIATAGSLSNLRSRFVGRATLEVWGRTNAPDGASIRMRVAAPGAASIGVPEVPAVAGRFYAKVALPAELQGRGVNIRARLAP